MTGGGSAFRTGHGGAGDASPPDPTDADPAAPPADAGEPGPLARVGRLLAGVPAFGKLLYRLLGDDRVSLLDRVIFGAALVYLFVPMDLVPDWLPALGQLDDLLIVGITLDRLVHRTDEAVLAEHWDGDEASLAALKGLLDRAVGMLPGWARGLLRAG